MYTSLSFATIYKSLLTKKRGNRQIQGNKFLVGLPDLNLWARLFRLLSKSSILRYKCIALAQQIELSQNSQVVEVRTSDGGVPFDQYDDLFDGHIDAFDEVEVDMTKIKMALKKAIDVIQKKLDVSDGKLDEALSTARLLLSNEKV